MNGAVTVNAEQVVMVMLVGCGRGKAKINHELVADTIQSVATRKSHWQCYAPQVIQ